MHCNKRTQVSFGILIGEIIAGESLAWNIFNRANIFQICRVFSFARYPNCVQLKGNEKQKIKLRNSTFFLNSPHETLLL
jgi:hypothetical protein